jgi:hypothetical protein
MVVSSVTGRKEAVVASFMEALLQLSMSARPNTAGNAARPKSHSCLVTR